MPRQLLYWVDQGKRSISRVDLEGRNRKTVVESNGYLDQPFGLAVFEVKQPHYSPMMEWRQGYPGLLFTQYIVGEVFSHPK